MPDDLELSTTKGGVNSRIEAQIRDMDSDSQELILDREEGIRRTVETHVSWVRTGSDDSLTNR